MVAVVPLIVPVPILVKPSKNDTVPVGGPGLTVIVAVTVTRPTEVLGLGEVATAVVLTVPLSPCMSMIHSRLRRRRSSSRAMLVTRFQRAEALPARPRRERGCLIGAAVIRHTARRHF